MFPHTHTHTCANPAPKLSTVSLNVRVRCDYCILSLFDTAAPPRYLLKMPDKWLNSTQGSKAKRRIEEVLAAKIAAGELAGLEYIVGPASELQEEDSGSGGEGGLLAEDESPGTEQQAS